MKKEKGIQRRAAQNRANGDQIQVECGELGEWKLMDDADVPGRKPEAGDALPLRIAIGRPQYETGDGMRINPRT
jgi:hypothetical protein